MRLRVAAALVVALAASAGAQPRRISDLPAAFYAREGLEAMPRVDYEGLPVGDVRDFGAVGDGVTDATAAFTATVAYLLSAGSARGGIVFVPKGVYLFSRPDETLAYWNLNPTVVPGGTARDPGFRPLTNIHIVGEGEDSIVRFMFRGIDQGNDFESQSARYVGWYLGGCERISLRDLSLTVFGTSDHRYYYNPPRTVSSGSDAYPSTGVHYVNVSVDQGAIGIQSQALVEDVWVVDSTVRNTTADGIAFYGVTRGRALYNMVENSGDDAYALWADSIPGVLGGDYLVLGNTALEVRFGRGILMKGQGALVKDNWIEKTVGAGLVSSASKDYVMSGDLRAVGNILVRNNMSGRPDNIALTNKNRGGVFVWGTYSTISYIRNRVYGSALDGFNFGSAMIDRLVIEGNWIASPERHGINVERAARVGELVVRDNLVFGAAGDDMRIDGAALGREIAGNLSSSSTKAVGFAATELESPYLDAYAPFRSELATGAKAQDDDEAAPAGLVVVDVRSFGAMGDGETDDRKAFERAIAALPDGGGLLLVGAGRYRIGSGEISEHSLPFTAVRQHLLIQGKSGVRIEGEGRASELVFTDPDMQGLKLLSVEGASIRNIVLRLEKKPSLRRNRALLDIAASRDVSVSGVRIIDSSGPGIYADCCTGIAIRGCELVGSGQYGIRLSAVVAAEVADNDIRDTRDHGILVNHFGGISREPRDIVVTRNSVIGSREGMGIAIGNGAGIEVVANSIIGTYMAGISIFQPTVAYPARSVSARGNALSDCNIGSNTYTRGAISLIMGSTTGFTAYSDVDLEVLDNCIKGTPKDGIHVDRYIADRVTIKGNRIEGAGGQALSVTKRAIVRRLVVEDNCVP